MFIEITPTTELPVFEAYLDGNGGTEAADGNDTVINSATQFTYLDGNFTSTVAPSTEEDEVTIVIDTYDRSLPTELSYNFPRTYPAVCAYYIGTEQQKIRAYFDGDNALITNTMYSYTEVDGSIDFIDGNAPRESVPLTLSTTAFNLIKTGSMIGNLLQYRKAFVFDQFIRLFFS